MSRAYQVLIIVLLLGVIALGGMLVLRGRETPAAPPAGVVVYAPCGMTTPLTTTANLYRHAHPEVKLNLVYDNAVVLVRKIRAGDRPDVFISPGELEMRQMVEEGYVDPTTVRDFGTLDLVLIAPAKTKDLAGLDDLKAPAVKTISLADPKCNSVGYYAEQALRSLGLWQPIQKKLLLREHALEAVTLVTSAQVDAGITYLTCPLDTAPEKADKSDVRIVAKLPRDAYPPVRCQLGILRESKQRTLSQQFVAFMASEQAQQAMAPHGLLPVKEIR